MFKRLQQDNLRMQQEMEATIYNLKARVSELEQNNKNFSSLNHFPGKSDYSQSHYDDLNKEVVKLRVSMCCVHVRSSVCIPQNLFTMNTYRTS